MILVQCSERQLNSVIRALELARIAEAADWIHRYALRPLRAFRRILRLYLGAASSQWHSTAGGID